MDGKRGGYRIQVGWDGRFGGSIDWIVGKRFIEYYSCIEVIDESI